MPPTSGNANSSVCKVIFIIYVLFSKIDWNSFISPVFGNRINHELVLLLCDSSPQGSSVLISKWKDNEYILMNEKEEQNLCKS
jgi:hypothetical protein